MKRTSPSAAAAAAAAAAATVMAKTSSTSATVRRTIKMQQFVGLMALIVAINCMKINLISAATNDDDEDQETNLKRIRQKCIASSGLTNDYVQLIYSHKLFTPNTTLANTTKPLQCYCLCYLNESTIFLDDKPNEKFLRDTLPLMINDKKKATAVLNKCLKLQGADKCEIGFIFELCLIRETGLYL